MKNKQQELTLEVSEKSARMIGKQLAKAKGNSWYHFHFLNAFILVKVLPTQKKKK